MYLLNNVVSRYFTCNIRIKISEKIKKLPVKFVGVGEKAEDLMVFQAREFVDALL